MTFSIKEANVKEKGRRMKIFIYFLDQDKTVLKCPSGSKGVFPGKKDIGNIGYRFFQC